MDMSLGKLQEMAKDREAWHAATLQSHKELDTTEQLNKNNNKNFSFQHRYPAIWSPLPSPTAPGNTWRLAIFLVRVKWMMSH